MMKKYGASLAARALSGVSGDEEMVKIVDNE
jgi:hypothetical protein